MSRDMYAIPGFSEEFFSKAENLKLAYNKYIPLITEFNGKITAVRDKDINQRVKSKVFGKVLGTKVQVLKDMVKQINGNLSKIASYHTFTTKSRLVVGLGSGTVLETSITLHHIYGIPYIPSSTVKGVLRAYNILKVAGFDLDKYREVEEEIEKIEGIEGDSDKERIVRIFGNQNIKGRVVFFDAFPENLPELEEDIVNVHYPDYYREAKPPQDNQNPIPIKYLTVKPGTRFRFYFLDEDRIYPEIGEDISKASEIVGFGSKTSVGYGILG